MKYISKQIVFREVPDEISLSYLISGCPLMCKGCHSADSWNVHAGIELGPDQLAEDLLKNKGWITCVLFMGGEWFQQTLVEYMEIIQGHGLKTALYTGLEAVAPALLTRLDYLKTGAYKRELGGLGSINTNQKLINLKTGDILNLRFHQNTEVSYDSTK